MRVNMNLNKRMGVGLMALSMFFLWNFTGSSTGMAQSNAAHADAVDIGKIQEEIKGLQAQQEYILKQIQGIQKYIQSKQIAENPPQPQLHIPDKVQTAGYPELGAKNAPVVLIEFADFQCPFCAMFANGPMGQIVHSYVDSGRLKIVYVDYPLSFHPNSMQAAYAAHCAGNQGKFWPMHNSLFADQGHLTPADLDLRVKKIGLDSTEYSKCMADAATLSTEIKKSTQLANTIGVQATPTFLLGVESAAAPDEVVVKQTIMGAYPYSRYESAIDSLLKATLAPSSEHAAIKNKQ